MILRKLLIVLFFSMMAVILHAQDTITLQSVEVRADHQEKTLQPLLKQKLDTLVLSSKSTSNLSQLLIQHSPVFIKTYGPGALSTASFRGTTASHTLVLWNGFQLNAPNMGQVDFSTIPVFLADDLSLSWGSGTANNSGGLGGVVGIETNGGFGKGLQLELKQAYGSFNTLGSFMTIGHYGKRFSVRVKAYRNSSDNDFEYENTATIPHQTMKQKNAQFVNYGFSPEMHLLTKKGVVSLVSWNQWNDRQLPPIMTNVGNINSEEWTKDSFSRNYVAYKTYWNTGSLTLKSACFFEKQNYFLETKNPVTGDRITYINSRNQVLALHQIANLEQTLYKTWKMNAKLQWDKEQVESDNYEGVKRRDVVSLFAAADGRPFRNAHLNFTLRHDVVDGTSKGLFPTATFSYEIPFLHGLTSALGYSHNYRNPSLNDLYWYPGGNENLLPEDGRTVDIDLKFERQSHDYSVEWRTGIYVSSVENWIQWVPTSFRYWVPKNVSKVIAKGIENHFSASKHFGAWNVSLSGNYVFTVTTDESEQAAIEGTKGKQLIYIPRHHGNLFADVKWKSWSLNYTLEMTGLRSTSYAEDDYFSYDLPAYVLHHVAFGKQIKKVKMEIRCNNIFDKAYQNVVWRAMPGRSLEAIVVYRY